MIFTTLITIVTILFFGSIVGIPLFLLGRKNDINNPVLALIVPFYPLKLAEVYDLVNPESSLTKTPVPQMISGACFFSLLLVPVLNIFSSYSGVLVVYVAMSLLSLIVQLYNIIIIYNLLMNVTNGEKVLPVIFTILNIFMPGFMLISVAYVAYLDIVVEPPDDDYYVEPEDGGQYYYDQQGNLVNYTDYGQNQANFYTENELPNNRQIYNREEQEAKFNQWQ